MRSLIFITCEDDRVLSDTAGIILQELDVIDGLPLQFALTWQTAA